MRASATPVLGSDQEISGPRLQEKVSALPIPPSAPADCADRPSVTFG